jgi:hypothetical protein
VYEGSAAAISASVSAIDCFGGSLNEAARSAAVSKSTGSPWARVSSARRHGVEEIERPARKGVRLVVANAVLGRRDASL